MVKYTAGVEIIIEQIPNMSLNFKCWYSLINSSNPTIKFYTNIL